jgi:tRNA modification GTPase
LRHKNALGRGKAALEKAQEAISEGYASEFVAVDLHEATDALEEILGKVTNEDILERVFKEFCIGK